MKIRRVLSLGDALQEDHNIDLFGRWSARKIVKRYDNNEDGKLSFEELNTAIKEQGFNVTITQDVFNAMDNGDRYAMAQGDEIHNGALTATEIENAAGDDELIENLVIVEDPETGGRAIMFQDDKRARQDWLDAERVKHKHWPRTDRNRERLRREMERKERQERKRRKRQAGGEEEEEEAAAPASAPVEEESKHFSWESYFLYILGLGYSSSKIYELYKEYKEMFGEPTPMTPKDLAIAEGLERAVNLETFHREVGEIVPNDDTECPVCSDKLSGTEWIVRRCGHAFCRECASEWGKRSDTCPMCVRKGVDFDPDSDLRIYRMQEGMYANLRF